MGEGGYADIYNTATIERNIIITDEWRNGLV